MCECRGKGLGPEPHGLSQQGHAKQEAHHTLAELWETTINTVSPDMPSGPDPSLLSCHGPEKQDDLPRLQAQVSGF